MTKALILAAGTGSRLMPLTKDKPKTLVKIFGNSLLQRQIKIFNEFGINDIAVVVGYKKKSIIELGVKYFINTNYKSTNMVHSFFCAENFFSYDEDLIISYGDIAFQKSNFSKLYNSKKSISLMIDRNWLDLWRVRFDDPLIDAETIKLDKNNKVLEIGKKSSNYNDFHGQYTGLIKIRSRALKKIVNFYHSINSSSFSYSKSKQKLDFTTFLQMLIDESFNIYGVVVNNGWFELDSISDFNIYENLYKSGLFDKFFKEDD